jgi:hypothetical protein
MKTNTLFCMLLCLILVFSSCNKDEDLKRYNGSKIYVEALEFTRTEAIVCLYAEDVKVLVDFTVGICYSTDADPSVQDEHIELNVKSDTLQDPDLYVFYFLEELTKSTDR